MCWMMVRYLQTIVVRERLQSSHRTIDWGAKTAKHFFRPNDILACLQMNMQMRIESEERW